MHGFGSQRDIHSFSFLAKSTNPSTYVSPERFFNLGSLWGSKVNRQHFYVRANPRAQLDGGTIDRAINDSRLACSQDTA